MEPDRNLIARAKKDAVQNLNVMRNNAVVMYTSKLSELINKQYQANERYDYVDNYIMNTPAKEQVNEMHHEWIQLRKRRVDIKGHIEIVKERLVHLRNGLDPRKLSRDELEFS